jgi:hypothetical protein
LKKASNPKDFESVKHWNKFFSASSSNAMMVGEIGRNPPTVQSGEARFWWQPERTVCHGQTDRQTDDYPVPFAVLPIFDPLFYPQLDSL